MNFRKRHTVQFFCLTVRYSGQASNEKAWRRARPYHAQKNEIRLKFLVEVARRAGDIDPARNAALSVFYALDDARRLAALGTVGRLRRVHYLLAVTCLCNLGHRSGGSPSGGVSAHTDNGVARGFNGADLRSKRARDSLPPVYMNAARFISLRLACSRGRSRLRRHVCRRLGLGLSIRIRAGLRIRLLLGKLHRLHHADPRVVGG